jgi:2',3'-cyclic-nucleotide 2'-phosphodiesterase
MESLPALPAPGEVRIVFVGDTVGKPGVRIACLAAPWFVEQLHADCLLVNAENAADGSGLRASDYQSLTKAGYHGVTLGDHIYKKKEIIDVLEKSGNIVRPCNLPSSAAGSTHMVVRTRKGLPVAVISALGRVFMKPVDCPFTAVDRELSQIAPEVTVRIIDFHAEATSDKQLMGRYLDGRVSAVLGTHTHVPTADEQIFPGGTGFQCDIGMTGPFESIIGRNIEAVLTSTLTAMPMPFHIAKGDVRVSATWMDIATESGRCSAIGRLSIRQKTLDEYHKSRSASSDFGT